MADLADSYDKRLLHVAPAKRYILTGAPGSGKTSVINKLSTRGFSTVPEAATTVIVQAQHEGVVAPWKNADFINTITLLQRQRQLDALSGLQFYDRSPICSYALSRYLGFPPSLCLIDEINRIVHEKIYEKQVFFVVNLGFMVNTQVRQISFQDALRFEYLHIEAYQEWGYEMIMIPVASVEERCERILQEVCRLSR